MCLHNEPVQHIDAPFCGDYIVNTEEGEECDCGGVDTCDDPCCHPNTCTLVAGASCSAMDLCCNPGTCQVRSAGYVCREESNECDVTEVCTGTSAECPNDDYNRAGMECTADGASGHCYAGSCRSVYSQCLQLYDPTGLYTDSAERD
ncbi:zinc metalloproteinase-disintegrin-like bothrojarin-4 [Symsagittifera roscoffensis]|uniref:zinc metalloproteinase-disintegrin-like bothrojarin-4 n=1 Tax=Symsagittifera roscoffensis TaxID=84072 RepID=UPI00307C31C6